MIGRCSWEALEAEIAKCVVRCANCHRARTAAQRPQPRGGSSPIQFASQRE
jgi:hypothetical protein